MPKLDKYTTKKEKSRPISFLNIEQNLQQNASIPNSAAYENNYYYDQVGFIPGRQGKFNI